MIGIGGRRIVSSVEIMARKPENRGQVLERHIISPGGRPVRLAEALSGGKVSPLQALGAGIKVDHYWGPIRDAQSAIEKTALRTRLMPKPADLGILMPGVTVSKRPLQSQKMVLIDPETTHPWVRDLIIAQNTYFMERRPGNHWVWDPAFARMVNGEFDFSSAERLADFGETFGGRVFRYDGDESREINCSAIPGLEPARDFIAAGRSGLLFLVGNPEYK